MAKLTRVTQQIFGLNGNAAHFGQFGSKAGGSPVLTLDPASIQALSAFTTDGWLDAIVGSNKQPFLEDMNGLFRVTFYQLAQIFQDGVAVWDSGTTYYTGSIVRKDGTPELYASLVDANTGNALPSQANNASWQYISGNRKKCGNFNAPGSPGTQSITGVGFKPRLVQFSKALSDSANAIWFGTGAMDSAGNQHCTLIKAGVAYEYTNSQSACIGLQDHTLASYVSMDSDGFTLSWSAADGFGTPVYNFEAFE